jgi:toxin ParE1/3/4
MNVRYTEVALQEVEEILTYIAKDNPNAALKVSASILSIVDRLSEFPYTAVETDFPDVRVTPVLPYQFLIFFSVLDNELVIRNVRHARRKRPTF